MTAARCDRNASRGDCAEAQSNVDGYGHVTQAPIITARGVRANNKGTSDFITTYPWNDAGIMRDVVKGFEVPSHDGR